MDRRSLKNRRAITGAIIFALFAVFARLDLFAAQAPANWKTDWETTQRAAEKEAKLVIYGPPGADQQKLYTEVFQQAFPKIRVNYTPGRISEIISRIMAEQRAGMRQADLVLGGTDILLGTLKDKGLLQPIRAALVLPEVLNANAWFKGKLWFADNEDKFVAMWRAVPTRRRASIPTWSKPRS